MIPLNNNVFLLFVVACIFMYNILIKPDPKGLFFLVIIVAIIYYLDREKRLSNENKDKTVNTFIDKQEEKIHEMKQINTDIYIINKPPKSLRFLRLHERIKKTLFNLRFLEIYNEHLLLRLICFLEYFFMLHYKIMTGKYDFATHHTIIHDVRREIMNIMRSIYFSIPSISKVVKTDLFEFTNRQVLLIQAITYKYMKILHRKFNPDTKSYQEPVYNDSYDEHYEIFT